MLCEPCRHFGIKHKPREITRAIDRDQGIVQKQRNEFDLGTDFSMSEIVPIIYGTWWHGNGSVLGGATVTYGYAFFQACWLLAPASCLAGRVSWSGQQVFGDVEQRVCNQRIECG